MTNCAERSGLPVCKAEVECVKLNDGVIRGKKYALASGGYQRSKRRLRSSHLAHRRVWEKGDRFALDGDEVHYARVRFFRQSIHLLGLDAGLSLHVLAAAGFYGRAVGVGA